MHRRVSLNVCTWASAVKDNVYVCLCVCVCMCVHIWVLTVTKWSATRQHPAGEMTWAKTKRLSYQVERERKRNTAILSNVFGLMERQQAGRQAAQRDIGLLTPVDGMTQITAVDTIVCGKTILCFSFLFISTLILGLGVWNQVEWWTNTVSGGGRAKRKEREGVCEWILRTVLDEQRHWQFLSLSFCLPRPLSLSLSLFFPLTISLLLCLAPLHLQREFSMKSSTH